MNELHERVFKLVYDDCKTPFSDLLAIDDSFTFDHTNIQTLLLEIYKIKHNLKTV